MWYLVIYQDDGNLRVLAQDKIHLIFRYEDEEVQMGDNVSSSWIPNEKHYDAKVVQIGGEVYFRETVLLTIKTKTTFNSTVLYFSCLNDFLFYKDPHLSLRTVK